MRNIADLLKAGDLMIGAESTEEKLREKLQIMIYSGLQVSAQFSNSTVMGLSSLRSIICLT